MLRNSSSGSRSHLDAPTVSADVDYSLFPETAPIGIFDSGVGGITVLRELYQQLPQESVLYFGDTARLPYGTRSKEEIIDFVRDILDWMVLQGTKMVIMACNTSSALALEAVRDEYDFPVLGLILPGAQAAAQAGDRIGVISTPATAKSGAYAEAIHEIDHQKQVWQIGCPEFVHIVEQGHILKPESSVVAQRYIAPLIQNDIDTLVYGCTHYPHLAPVLKQLLSDTVQFIDPAAHVVASATRELDAMGLRNFRQPMPTRFCVSSNPQQFSDVSMQWLGYNPTVELINLANILDRELASGTVASDVISQVEVAVDAAAS